MSCHCCPCDHSGTIRQYFSNINLWTNSKVSQLDRQSDESAGYHCDGEGCVIKEQRCCPWCWNPLLFQPLYMLAPFFFLVTFFSFFWKKKEENFFFFPALFAYRKSPGEFELQQFPPHSKCAELFGSIHLLSRGERASLPAPTRHQPGQNLSSPWLIEWEKLNIFFAAETRHRRGNGSYRARADMPPG